MGELIEPGQTSQHLLLRGGRGNRSQSSSVVVKVRMPNINGHVECRLLPLMPHLLLERLVQNANLFVA